MNAKVKEYKQKFKALQEESNEIYKQIRLMLKRLKDLAKCGIKLANELDSNKDLYKTQQIHCVDEHGNKYTDKLVYADGWNTNVIFKLHGLDNLLEDIDSANSSFAEMDDIFYGIKHIKFMKQKNAKRNNDKKLT